MDKDKRWKELCEITSFAKNFAECHHEIQVKDLDLFKEHGWEFFNGGYASYSYSYYFRKLRSSISKAKN